MLSENIKAARKSKGLSQEELAVKLNIVRQTLSKWERGLSCLLYTSQGGAEAEEGDRGKYLQTAGGK